MSEQVFRELLDALLAGRYAPGEKLPGQRALARDMGVTLGSLREALKRLEQMRLVEVRHGDAMRVRPWREAGGLDVLAHVLFRAGALDVAVLDDVLEARALMLRELAGLAAQRRDDASAQRLAELAAAFAEAGDDAGAAAFVDFAFFTEVSRAAGNVVFDLILNAIRDLYLEHHERIPVTGRPAELAPRYAEIAAAVRERDAETAQARAFELATAQAARVREGR
ncbi:FadR/GntR family transcriptional regulator [Conexibacter sp. SYSU D00693]|uniref:FadR/GntR family transcriptional regulator n=1 Tax=Conexibacter sp. SYSU D00693 TaxID=2812560 RepID=UPI00196A315A|nr:GntR family transcriptional regulator [Conexibacter sp. SYSU D00693]